MPDKLTQTYQELGKVMAEYRALVIRAKDAQLKAKGDRQAADVAFSAAFLRAGDQASPSQEATKRHIARTDEKVQELELAAGQSEVEYDHLKRAIKWCEEEVMALMAEGSYRKAEARTLGLTPDTWT